MSKKTFNKKLGYTLLAVSVFLLSPIDDLLYLLPLAIYFNLPELILVINVIAALLLITSFYLLGTPKVIRTISKHRLGVIISIIVFIIFLAWYLLLKT